MKRRYFLSLVLCLPLALFLTGCSGGVNGEGTNDYSNTKATPIVRANSFNDAGWDMISKGQYESAITQFNTVLSDNPTDDERAQANNGIGWARGNLGSLSDGMPFWERAIGLSDDAKIGLASAYVQKGSKADLEMAIELIYKQLGGENSHFHYTPRRSTGVSDAEAHALLAYAFAGVGRNDEATVQIDYAKELNPAWENTTIDQLAKMVEFLLR